MSAANTATSSSLLICFSHLRWDFVFQRPQHLMQRFAKVGKVVYWEEPIPAPGAEFGLDRRDCGKTGVTIITPHVPDGWSDEQIVQA